MRKHSDLAEKKLFYKAKIGHLVNVIFLKRGDTFSLGQGMGMGKGVGEGSVALDPGSEL